MTDEAGTSGAPSVSPRVVEYDPVTGVPSEFNEFLPHESQEYKKWKATAEGPEALEKLTLKDSKTGRGRCVCGSAPDHAQLAVSGGWACNVLRQRSFLVRPLQIRLSHGKWCMTATLCR